jgi:hypothetical protein
VIVIQSTAPALQSLVAQIVYVRGPQRVPMPLSTSIVSVVLRKVYVPVYPFTTVKAATVVGLSTALMQGSFSQKFTVAVFVNV